MATKAKTKAIIVTTIHRGVFYGEVPEKYDLSQKTMSLQNARCAIYWGTTKGIAELASTGPTSKSRIGAAADLPALHDITAVWSVSDEARAKWITA
jgi:hypothetical protein